MVWVAPSGESRADRAWFDHSLQHPATSLNSPSELCQFRRYVFSSHSNKYGRLSGSPTGHAKHMSLSVTEPIAAVEDGRDVAQRILAALAASQSGVGRIECPLHFDSRPSLLLAGRLGVVRCAAGCLDGKWAKPAVLFRAMGLDKSAITELCGQVPQVASPVRKAAKYETLRSDLRCVLEYLDERWTAKTRLFGRAQYSQRVHEWASYRGYSLDRLDSWLREIDGLDRAALQAAFSETALQSAGLKTVDGRWVCSAWWGLLVVCRNRQKTPIWAQAVGLTRTARQVAKYRNLAGVPPQPFGLDTLGSKRRIVIAEGLTDSLSLLSSGMHLAHDGSVRSGRRTWGVLGVPGVASWKTSWFDEIADGTEVIVAFDADDAGDKASERVQNLLGSRCHVWRWRPENGDLNDAMLSLSDG